MMMGKARATKDPAVKVGIRQMAGGLLKTGAQALVNGKVSREVREERYETCKQCPAFRPNDKRCSDCGCFMEAKTWIAGPPEKLCPRNKWAA